MAWIGFSIDVRIKLMFKKMVLSTVTDTQIYFFHFTDDGFVFIHDNVIPQKVP